jgi:hypothetical protein
MGFVAAGFFASGQCQQVLLVGEGAAQVMVLGGYFGLLAQPLYLAFQLLAQVFDALQIGAGIGNAVFGFAAAFLVFGHAGGFFQIGTQFFRPRFDDARDHALFDHRIATRTTPVPRNRSVMSRRRTCWLLM